MTFYVITLLFWATKLRTMPFEPEDEASFLQHLLAAPKVFSVKLRGNSSRLTVFDCSPGNRRTQQRQEQTPRQRRKHFFWRNKVKTNTNTKENVE